MACPGGSTSPNRFSRHSPTPSSSRHRHRKTSLGSNWDEPERPPCGLWVVSPRATSTLEHASHPRGCRRSHTRHLFAVCEVLTVSSGSGWPVPGSGRIWVSFPPGGELSVSATTAPPTVTRDADGLRAAADRLHRHRAEEREQRDERCRIGRTRPRGDGGDFVGIRGDGVPREALLPTRTGPWCDCM